MAWVTGAAMLGGAVLGSMSANKASGAQKQSSGQAIDETRREYDQSRRDLAPYREAGTAALSRLRTLLGINSGVSGVDENDPRFQAIYQPMVDSFDRAHQARFRTGPRGVQGISIYDPQADQASVAATLDRLKGDARRQFLAQYGDQSETNPESGALLRKFSKSDLEDDPVYNSGLEFGLNEGTKAVERRAAARGGYDSGATLKELVRFGNDYGSTKANESYGRFTSDQDRTFGKLSGIAGLGSGATSVGVGAGVNAASNLSNLYTGAGNAAAAAALAQGNAFTNAANNYAQYRLLSQLSGGGQRTVTPSAAPAVYGE